MYNKVIWLNIHMYLFFFRVFSHLGYYRTWSRGLCAIQGMPALSLQSSLTLCTPIDHSLPGSSIHGILQARILEWVAIASSSESSRPGIEPGCLASPALARGSLSLGPPGTPDPCVYVNPKPPIYSPPSINLFPKSVSLFQFCK